MTAGGGDGTAGDERIRAVVSDSGYAEMRELVEGALPGASGLPAFFTPVTLTVAKSLLGLDVDEIRPENAVGNLAPRPVLIIHGTADATVPVAHAYRLASACPGASLWTLPGVEHVGALATEPAEYLRRVEETFARAQ